VTSGVGVFFISYLGPFCEQVKVRLNRIGGVNVADGPTINPLPELLFASPFYSRVQ